MTTTVQSVAGIASLFEMCRTESTMADPTLQKHSRAAVQCGVGNVRVGWRGDEAGAENLELISVEQLTAEELAKAREEALKLEKRAYENSKDVYALSEPAQLATEEPPGSE